MTEYYAHITDNVDNDFKNRLFPLHSDTMEQAQSDLENHILDEYFGEDRDSYLEQKNPNFYFANAQVLAVESRAFLSIDSLISEFRIKAKQIEANYEREKLRKEYERLKAIFEPEKPAPKKRSSREAYRTDNSKCAVFCEHANECLSGPCQCYSDCYCRHYGSCKNECIFIGGHDWKVLVTGNEDIRDHKPAYVCEHCGAVKVENKI